MTHVMRLLVVSALAAGTGWVLAQDDSLDALLMDLGGVEEVTPKQNEAGKEAIAEPEAEKDDADIAPAPAPEVKQDDGAMEEPAAPEITPEPEVTPPQPEPAPEPEITPEPEVTPEVTPAPEAIPQPEPAPEPEPAPQPEIAPEPEADPAPVPGDAPDPAPAAAAPAPAAGTPKISPEEAKLAAELEALYQLRVDTLNQHGLDSLKLADAAYARGDFDEALRKYNEAGTYIRNREDMVPNLERARVGIRNAYYGKAKALIKQGDLEEAKNNAVKAKSNGHTNADRLISDIDEKIAKKAKERRPSTTTYLDSEAYTKERLAIQNRLNRASIYFSTTKLASAMEQVDLILREDPYNREAIELRKKIAEKQILVEDDFRDSTHKVMIKEVLDNWTPKNRLAADSIDLTGTTEVTSGKGKVVTQDPRFTQEQVIKGKLGSIKIPEVKFQPPATIIDAVDFFNQVSINFDNPELPIEQRGVNIVLKLNAAGAAAPAAPAADDPFAMAGATGGASSSGAPEIPSIRMRNVSLKEALDMVCEVTGMKYSIRGNAIMIIPRSQSVDDLETRSYNVMSTIVERSGAITSELGSQQNSFTPVAMPEAGDSASQLKTLFSQMGVLWPDGSSIAYLSAIGKLRVKNTAENLAALESALDELNVTPYQVEVEARFVEVSQSDLNSLGFEWTLNQNLTGTIGNGINWNHLHDAKTAGGGLFVAGSGGSGTKTDNIGMQGGPDAFNQGMRFMGDANTLANRVNLSNSSLPTDDRFAMVSAVFGELDISMILHMLSQRTDTDLLSSPKVVARPGQEAVMQVVTEYIYPTSFEVKELDINTGSNGSNAQLNIPVPFAVEPQNFEMRPVGVILQVVPEVSTEGQMINLVVNPQVIELREWHNYGMKIPYTPPPTTTTVITDALGTALDTLTGSGATTTQEYINLDMPQPFFHVRSVNTQLSVYNGATVVMGGMINEVRKSFDDKIPILGDLPFIGFLFRSKAEFSDKRNLLIFLTARLVDPAGKTVRTAVEASNKPVAAPAPQPNT